MIKNIEMFEKAINEDKENWSKREKFYQQLYQYATEGHISSAEYISTMEKNIKQFLSLQPNHELARQTMAHTLQKKLNIVATKEDELAVYRELVNFSTKQRIKDTFITKLYSHQETLSKQTRIEIIHLILNKANFPEYFIILFDDPHRCYNIATNKEKDVIQLETVLRHLVALNLNPTYKQVLAELIFNKIDFTIQNTLQDFEHIQIALSEVTKLVPNVEQYKQKYIVFLNEMEQYVRTKISHEDQQVYLLTSIYKKLHSFQPENESVVATYEDILLKNIQIIEKNFTGPSATQHKLNVYKKLVHCRPNYTVYSHRLRDLRLQSGKNLKRSNHFLEAHTHFDQVATMRHSSNKDIAKAYYYKGLANMQEQKWNEAYRNFLIVDSHKRYLFESLLFEFYFAFAVCCIQNQKEERANALLKEMQSLDTDKKYIRETEFVKMYIHMFSNIIHYHQFDALQKKNSKITHKELEHLLDTSIDESSSTIILDRRNESHPLLYGPVKSIAISADFGSLLSYVMHLTYPVPGRVIMENIEIQTKNPRDKFKELNNKIREVLPPSIDKYKGKLANYDNSSGYIWKYPYPSYVIEEE